MPELRTPLFRHVHRGAFCQFPLRWIYYYTKPNLNLFFSYLPTCEVNLIEILEIMAQMEPSYIIFKYKFHDIFNLNAPLGVFGVSKNPRPN